MRSEGSRFIWGFGGEAVFAESCVYVRNRSQPSATVRVRAVSSPQWRVHLEWSRKRVKLTRVAAFILVFAAEVSVWAICVAAVILVFAEELSVRVSCVAVFILVFAEEVSVWVICVAAVILAFAVELSVWVIGGAAVILVFAQEMFVSLICVAAVILVFAAEVSVWVMCVAAVYFGVCRGGVCVSDLWHCNYISVRRGRVCVNDLCPRRGSSKSVVQECHVRSVKYECVTRVSSKKWQARVSYKSVK